MGISLSIVTPPISDNNEEAWKQLRDLNDKERGWSDPRRLPPLNHKRPKANPPPEFRQLHGLLVERYPCLSSQPNGSLEETIWKDSPIWNSFGTRVATLSIRTTSDASAVSFIIENANSLGLIVYDPQTGSIYRKNAGRDL